jgi:pimeloyl-ACP methyl ester carboxylesterase
MKKVMPASARPNAPWHARRADDGYGVTAQPNWREVDWPRHLHRMDVDGVSINYVDMAPESGDDREPVVFVHGLAGQWQNWLENLPRVAQQRRVIAMDLPGFGMSEPSRGDVSIPGYGRCVEAICRRLDLGPVSLVGNSMGGFIAGEVAIQVPDRVERLVLVSAAGISTNGIYAAPLLTVGRAVSAVSAHRASQHRRVARRPVTRHLALALVARHPSRLKADLAYEGFMKGAGKPGFNDAFRACFEYDFRERLPEVGAPTLIVWGEEDAIIPVRDAHEFERLIPDARKVVMRETGHISMAERPEAFNDLLLDFLAETGPAEDKERVEGESQAA